MTILVDAELLKGALSLLIERAKRQRVQILAHLSAANTIVQVSSGEIDVAGLIEQALADPSLKERANEEYAALEDSVRLLQEVKPNQEAMQTALRAFLSLSSADTPN